MLDKDDMDFKKIYQKLVGKSSKNKEKSSDNRDKLAMAVRIIPNVYLGDNRAADSSTFFDKTEIKGVLNMTPNLPHTFRELDTVEYLRIPVYDSHVKRDVNLMYRYFPIVTEYMFKISVVENSNLLVHCHLGRQRSCTAVAAYLIKYYDMTPIEAMKFILQRKPDAFHWGKNANFAKALNKWYYKLNPQAS